MPFSLQVIDRKYVSMLVQSRAFLEYVIAVLIEERSSLNNQYVFNFMSLAGAPQRLGCR